MTKSPEYEKNVFINCPFDGEYKKLLYATIFAVQNLGFRARCALDEKDARTRVEKISEMIRSSKYSIHDISRVELDKKSNLPRFNMAFELGLDLGCKEFNRSYHDKKSLILDSVKNRHQKCFSDIAGFDPEIHEGRVDLLIQIISDWMRVVTGDRDLPNGMQIINAYKLFKTDFKTSQKMFPLKPSITDYSAYVYKWINTLREGQDDQA